MTEQTSLAAEKVVLGVPAPDFVLTASTGDRVRLSDFRGRKRLVVFFMRAFNCMQCRDFARRLAESAPELAAADTQIIVIGPGTRKDAEKLSRTIDPQGRIDILHDGTGEVYDAYMLDRVFFSLIQKSAAFIVDKRGIIEYAYATANPNRWLNSKALKELLGEPGQRDSA